MPATQIPQYLYVPDPASLSFARYAAKPFRERAPRESQAGQGFEEPQHAQIVSGGYTQQDSGEDALSVRERQLQERERVLQERENSLQERERAPKQPSPPEHVNQYGFPRPGPQSPSPAEATGKHYFVDETNWKEILG